MPSGNGKVDVELDNIISRISHVQKKLGGTVTDGAPTAFIGDDGKVDRFEELKSIIKGHFDDLQKLTDDIVELKQDNNRESTTERIQKEQNHRKVMGQLDAEVKELDELQRGEGKKKRSKYTRADLEIRASEAALLRRKLEDTKEFSRRGFVGNREGYATNRIVDMKDSELFNGSKGGKAKEKVKQETVTAEQQQAMLQIEKRDAEIDNQLETVSAGLDILKSLAVTQNEEVKAQEVMLGQLDEKMESVQDHVLNINDKLKTTLDQARAGDKLCIDIFCLLLMGGMIFVLYKVSQSAGSKSS